MPRASNPLTERLAASDAAAAHGAQDYERPTRIFRLSQSKPLLFV